MDVRTDGAAVETEHRLVRQDERDRVMVGRAAARCARFFAQAAHHHVGCRPTTPEPELEPSEAARVVS